MGGMRTHGVFWVWQIWNIQIWTGARRTARRDGNSSTFEYFFLFMVFSVGKD